MRIGIYLGDFSPDAGGGFTFQDEVFRSFASEVKVSNHEYVVLYSRQNIIDYVCSVNPSMETYRVQSDLADRCKESLKIYSPLLAKYFGPGAVEKSCTLLKLDLLWYVGGGAFEVLDTPYIATVWDLQHRMTPWFPEMSNSGVWEARELAYRRYLQRASYVVTGTEVGRQELLLNYGVATPRVRCLAHPTPTFVTESLSNISSIIQRLGLQPGYLFYPAQFWPHKNHIGLLYGLAFLRDKYDVRLPLVLTGSDKGNARYIKLMADKLQLSEQIIFTGFISQQEMVELYTGASMLVYASLCGPENLPPLEAFALGCPVVAANVPGAKEQLGDAALLYDPLNSEDMAEKIHILLEQSELRNLLRDKGLRRAAAWTVGNFAEGMKQIFDEFALYRRTWPSRYGVLKED